MKHIFFLLIFFFLYQNTFAGYTLTQTNQWSTGYCSNIKIVNDTAVTAKDWVLQLKIPSPGNIYNFWSGNFVLENGVYKITGVSWNKTLYPQTTTDIGFCVTNTTQKPTDISLNLNPTSSGTTTNTPTSSGTTTNTPTSSGTTSTVPSTDILRISYPEQQWANADIDLNNDGLSDTHMEINPWNIASSQGTATMTFNKQTQVYNYSQDLTQIVLSNPSSWVHGYPEVFVGKKPWSGESTKGFVALPKKVNELTSLGFTTQYVLNNTSAGPINFAAEGWIVQDKEKVGVSTNDIEFMIMLYRNNIGPAGNKVGTYTTSIKLNGTQKTETFDVYKNVGGWNFFTFVPQGNYNNQKVDIDLLSFVPEIKKYISYDISQYYFMNWEIGSEYGSPTTTSSKFNWELSKFNVDVNTTVSTLPSPVTQTGSFDFSGLNTSVAGTSEIKLVKQNYTFTTTGFQDFATKFDVYLENKLANFTIQNYNKVIQSRNTLLSGLFDFELKKITKTDVISIVNTQISILQTLLN